MLCNEGEVFYKIEKRKTKRSTCVKRFAKDFILQWRYVSIETSRPPLTATAHDVNSSVHFLVFNRSLKWYADSSEEFSTLNISRSPLKHRPSRLGDNQPRSASAQWDARLAQPKYFWYCTTTRQENRSLAFSPNTFAASSKPAASRYLIELDAYIFASVSCSSLFSFLSLLSICEYSLALSAEPLLGNMGLLQHKHRRLMNLGYMLDRGLGLRRCRERVAYSDEVVHVVYIAVHILV